MKKLLGKKLTQKYFETAYNTQKILHASAASSTYAITSVDNAPCSEPTPRDRSEFRSPEEVKAEWESLKKDYQTS